MAKMIGFYVTRPQKRRNLKRLQNDSPYSEKITYFVGRRRTPLTLPSSYSVCHSNGNNELTFSHIGNEEGPKVQSWDVLGCKSIVFNGQLSSVNSLFRTSKQLHRCNSVTILIGHKQQQYVPELYRKFVVCPSVTSLKIVVDQIYFEQLPRDNSGESIRGLSLRAQCRRDKQYSIVQLIRFLLIGAQECFPYLEQLQVELPENELIDEAVQALIEGCRYLRKGAEMEEEAQQVLDDADAARDVEYAQYNGNERYAERRPITNRWNIETSSDLNEDEQVCDEGYYSSQPVYPSSSSSSPALSPALDEMDDAPPPPPPDISALLMLAMVSDELSKVEPDVYVKSFSSEPRQDYDHEHELVSNWLESEQSNLLKHPHRFVKILEDEDSFLM